MGNRRLSASGAVVWGQSTPEISPDESAVHPTTYYAKRYVPVRDNPCQELAILSAELYAYLRMVETFKRRKISHHLARDHPS